MRMTQMAMAVLTGNMLTDVINMGPVLWGEPRAPGAQPETQLDSE